MLKTNANAPETALTAIKTRIALGLERAKATINEKVD